MRIERATAPLISAFAAMLIWELVAWLEWVPHEYFPPLHQVIQTLWQLVISGELTRAWLVTMERAIGGLLLATAVALAVAMMAARYDLIRRAIDPVAELLRPLPPAAIVPMSIFFFGLGWKLYSFILVFACFWPVYLSASAALGSVPRILLANGRAFGYGPWSLLLSVRLPAALPGIFIGVRLAAAVALIATIVAEMLAGRDGIGFFLVDAGFSLRTREMFASLLVVMFSGILINQIVAGARHRLCDWHARLSALGT